MARWRAPAPCGPCPATAVPLTVKIKPTASDPIRAPRHERNECCIPPPSREVLPAPAERTNAHTDERKRTIDSHQIVNIAFSSHTSPRYARAPDPRRSAADPQQGGHVTVAQQ